MTPIGSFPDVWRRAEPYLAELSGRDVDIGLVLEPCYTEDARGSVWQNVSFSSR